MTALRTAFLAILLLSSAPVFAAEPAAAPPPPAPTTNVSAAPAGLYVMDKSHAAITFRISHLGFSLYQGRLNSFDSTINLDPTTPEKSTVNVGIDMASVYTNNAKLEGELRDWFKVSQFPTATFKSTKLTRTGPATGELDGDLTFMGQTHPIKLAMTFQGYGPHPMNKKPTMGFSATGVMKRSVWGFTNYLPMIGDDVLLQIDAEYNKADAAPAAAPVPPGATPATVTPAAPTPAPAK